MSDETPNESLDRGRGADALDLTDGRDRAVLRGAAKRWGISPELKEKCISKLQAALDIAETARDINGIVKTMATIEGQNQADEHLDRKLKEGVSDSQLTIKVLHVDMSKEANDVGE